jgi:hypothetical protein
VDSVCPSRNAGSPDGVVWKGWNREGYPRKMDL